MIASQTTSDKAYRPFLWGILFPVAVVCALAFPAYLYYGAPVGGLTRIGFWPERDYLPRLVQAPIVLAENVKVMVNPDVLVIGDSFAFGNVWQSVAAEKTRLKIQTHGYPSGKDCFVDWIKAQPQIKPSVKEKKWIVIETVERAFLWRMKNFQRCDDRVTYAFVPVAAGAEWQMGTVSDFSEIDLMRQIKTLVNQTRLAFSPEKKLGDAARNVALKSDSYFSNQRSDRLLYLDHDEGRLGWTNDDVQAAVQNLKNLQQEVNAQGYQLMVLVVPDKLHVYEDVAREPVYAQAGADVSSALRQAGIASPDVLGAMKRLIAEQKDVYLPNDTHTSVVGYRAIGEVVAKALGEEH